MGRWSKPHVATITHTAIDELRDLASSANMVFGANINNIKELADLTANELLGSLNLTDAQHFAELMCLPFLHHHEKHHLNYPQSVKKTPSGNSLAKLNMSSSELHPIKGGQSYNPILFKREYQINLDKFKRTKLCQHFQACYRIDRAFHRIIFQKITL